MSNAQLPQPNQYPRSPDGSHYWNGTAWIPAQAPPQPPAAGKTAAAPSGPPPPAYLPLATPAVKVSRTKHRMIERAQPLLPPGTEIRQIIFAGTRRPMPWYIWPFFLLGVLPGFLILIIYAMTTKGRVLAVTPDTIYVLDCGRGGQNPKRVLGVLPRATRLGPPVGSLNIKVAAGPETLWSGRMFAADILAADAEGAQMHPAAQVPAISPDGAYWWDGAQWQPMSRETDQGSAHPTGDSTA